ANMISWLNTVWFNFCNPGFSSNAGQAYLHYCLHAVHPDAVVLDKPPAVNYRPSFSLNDRNSIHVEEMKQELKNILFFYAMHFNLIVRSIVFTCEAKDQIRIT